MTSSSEKLCPALKNKKICLECPEVEQEWHINKLLEEMAFAKGFIKKYPYWEPTEEEFPNLKVESKNLNDNEICSLFLLLKGWDTENISNKFYRNNLKSEFSKGLYKYIKKLTGKKITNWAQVRFYLEQAGFRKRYLVSVEQEPLEIRLTISGTMSHESMPEFLNQINKLIGNGSLSID